MHRTHTRYDVVTTSRTIVINIYSFYVLGSAQPGHRPQQPLADTHHVCCSRRLQKRVEIVHFCVRSRVAATGGVSKTPNCEWAPLATLVQRSLIKRVCVLRLRHRGIFSIQMFWHDKLLHCLTSFVQC